MKTQADHTQPNTSKATAHSLAKPQSDAESAIEFDDKRPASIQMQKMQELANNSPKVKQLSAYQKIANQNQAPVAQRANNSAAHSSIPNQQDNKTGLPHQLKSGIENLSGHAMDDVKVHYNSEQPSQLKAHAFAQGSDIHLSSGQEKHLPHEAWHVVQQKQGRVKPTLQMKGEININDDAGLEQEADLMGAKALNMPIQRKWALSESGNSAGKTTQLKDDDEFELLDAGDEYNIEAEKNVNPKSDQHKKKLAELKKGGAQMGEESQIELQGELTMAARVNRFFGNESTYAQLSRKAGEFNKSKDVAEKQALLKELKPLAQTWLERHAQAEASGEKQDENEELKRVSVYKFLNQTTSNYPEIINIYTTLKNTMAGFIGAPLNERNKFFKAVDDYHSLTELVKTYKSTYPPSVNLLYLNELDDINAADKGITKSGPILGSDFETDLGFSVINPEVNFNLISGKYGFSGKLNLTIDNLVNAEGVVKVQIDDKNNIKNIEIEDGSCEADIAGLQLKLNGIAYDYSAGQFTVKEAGGVLEIFDNKVALSMSGVSITKDNFDYEKIEGELPDVDYGFFSLKTTSISYSKKLNAFEGETTYQFNTKESPLGMDNFQTNGDVKIHWSPEGEKYYSIDNGNLIFKLLGQQAEAKKFSYNSTDGKLNAEELSISVGINDFNKTFTGKNIAISKEGIDFEELSTDPSGAEFNVKVFSLKPKEYKIAKDKDGGLKVLAHGSISVNLPDYLGVESTGEIEGNVGLNFNKSISPDYQITAGKAEMKMPNPLNKISEILGDNWTSSRYELSAAIPVFPAISAIFGLYIEYGGKFAKELAATIELDNEKKSIKLHASTNFTANVEGGVFGGIQGGSQLLIALALLLRAAGKFDMNTEIGYQKHFPLEEQPAGGQIKEDSGFTYDIKGEAKVGAYLDIVATALYFFRKQFSLTLGEKSLGAFEFSNTKKSDPNMGDTALADRKALDKHIDPSAKEEAKGLTIEQLLDLDYNHRFKEKEKKEAIDVIKGGEAGRAEAYQKDNQNPAESKKFNNVPLANLQFYNQFIDNRCNWAEIYKVLGSLGGSLKSEQELIAHSDKGASYLKEQILASVKNLGSSSNIAQVFVDHYKEKVGEFAAAYPKETISAYHQILLQKVKVIESVENMKKEYLHSSFWGDESQQLKNIQTDAWFGESKYEKFAIAYKEFSKVMLTNKSGFDKVDELGQQTAFKLVQAHQREIEKSSK